MEINEISKIAESICSILKDEERKKESILLFREKILMTRVHQGVLNIYDKLTAPHIIDIRYLALASIAIEIDRNKVKGDIAELGVYRGVFAKRIHALLPGRNFYLIDTYNSFDENQIEHDRKKYNLNIVHRDRKRFINTSVDIVLKIINGNTEYLHPIVGLCPSNSKYLENKNFSFVSLDVDLYQPMKDGVEFFYPRLSPGGFIMAHDFNNCGYPGPHDAILEWSKKNKIPYVPLPDKCGSCIIAKPL